MTRTEIISVLKDKGVNPKLLEMPAVVEELYRSLEDSTIDELLSNKFFSVEENGNFTYGNTTYSLLDNGARKDNHYSGRTIHINKYGIEDSEYSEHEWIDFFDVLSRNNGKVISRSGNNGNATSSESTYLDNGDYSILSSKGERILGDDDYDICNLEKVASMQIDGEKSLAKFDRNAEKIKAIYPITTEWYDQTRKSLLECIENQNNPGYMYKKVAEKLNQEVRWLKADNESLRRMLSKSLNFIEHVKYSPVGKLFFGKQIKHYDDKDR